MGTEANFAANRRFLPRNQAFYSSYGPGNFGSYDTKFYLYAVPEGGHALQLFDFSSGIVSEMLDGVAGEPMDGVFHDDRNKMLKKLTLLDASGSPTTTLSSAVTAELEGWFGVTTVFSMINLSTDPQAPDYAGRLTNVMDSKGYNLTVSYRDGLPAGAGGFTVQELIDSPDRRFQVHQVVDYQSDTATFEYGTAQVGGRWAVSRIVTPGGDDIDYTYTGDRLTKVTYANGSESTFVYGQDTVAQTVTIETYEARGGSAMKKLHLTNDYMTVNNQIINQPQGVLRMIEDDSNEVTLMVVPDDSDPAKFLTYTGSSEAAEVIHGVSSQNYEDGWTFNLQVAIGDPIIGDLEPTYDSAIGASTEQLYQGTIPQETDETGRTYSFEYDADTFQTKKTWDGDGTYEEYSYDADKNMIRKRDRMGRVTKWEYNANGSVTKAMFGILEVNGVDVNQPEYAETVKEYYPSTHVNKGLLKTMYSPLYDHSAGSPDMYRTDYEYDGRGNVTKTLHSAAHSGQDRPEWTYSYDTEDRKISQVDPMGYTVAFVYDSQSRVTRTTYDDGSTEETLYGAPGSDQEHLVLKRKDRRDVVTSYAYDTSGRPSTVTVASSLDADILDGLPDDTPITDRDRQSITTYSYLEGTSLLISVSADGSTTDTIWDYRHREIESITYPRANKSLHLKSTYVDNELFSEEDAYGRLKYYGYRLSDGALIRYVTGAFAAFALADEAAVFALTRDQSANASYSIREALKNNAGQLDLVVDGRGIQHKTEYNSSGAAIRKIGAMGTPVEAKVETDYDAAINPIEVRGERYFDPNDPNGFQKCKTLMTYDGRGNLASRTESPGTAEVATESFTHTLDDRPASHTDFRGKVWTTSYAACCGQGVSTKNPLGHGGIKNTDHSGRATHMAGIALTDTHTNLNDPLDAKTLEEVTVRFDELGRRVASTQWLIPQAQVEPNAVPIAGLDGVSGDDGLTAQTIHDVDLTDGEGLDDSTGLVVDRLGGGSYSVSLASALAKLAEPVANGGGNLSFGAGATGSAAVSINAEEELSFLIYDAKRRPVMKGVIEPHGGNNPNALMLWVCTVHDATVSRPLYGDLLETRTVDALGHSVASLSDGRGQILEKVDQAGFVSTLDYDANGNVIKTRDPNNVGEDCVFDELNRRTACTDTANHTAQAAYDRAGNRVSETDAKNASTTYVIDARGRRVQETDRLNHVTKWEYDAGGKLLSVEDAEGQVTKYTYDDAGYVVSEESSDHIPGSVFGDPGYGLITMTYDAIGNRTTRQDQQGDGTTLNRDMAGRLNSRVYAGHATGPLATQNDTDLFTYDKAGRLLSGTKGRYSNTVNRAYDDAGRLSVESLVIGPNTYSTAVAYSSRGEVIGLTYPDGTQVARTQTPRGLLHTLSRSGSVVDTRTYDDGGRLLTSAYSNGITETRAYNTNNTLGSIQFGGAPIGDMAYSWDENENKTGETVTGVMSGYGFAIPTGGFDAEDRLVTRNRSDGNHDESWVLTSVGDWASVTLEGVTKTRTHDLAHELTTAGGGAVSHDAKGNMTSVPSQLTSGSSGMLLSLDFDNRLQAADTDGQTGNDVTYEYDALGRRVRKDNGTDDIVYALLGGQVLAEYGYGDAPTSATESYVYGTYVDEPVLKVGTGGNTFYHRNQQYSIVAMTDGTGSVVERYAYSAYGDLTILDENATPISDSTVGNTYTYTGRRFDADSGMYYFRARMFHPRVGRFLSRDPKRFVDGLNLYQGYFAPKGLDPTGMEEWWCTTHPYGPFDIDDKTPESLRQIYIGRGCGPRVNGVIIVPKVPKVLKPFHETGAPPPLPPGARQCGGLIYNKRTHCCKNDKIIAMIPNHENGGFKDREACLADCMWRVENNNSTTTMACEAGGGAAGGGAGMLIGSCICPGIGTAVGGLIGCAVGGVGGHYGRVQYCKSQCDELECPGGGGGGPGGGGGNPGGPGGGGGNSGGPGGGGGSGTGGSPLARLLLRSLKDGTLPTYPIIDDDDDSRRKIASPASPY